MELNICSISLFIISIIHLQYIFSPIYYKFIDDLYFAISIVSSHISGGYFACNNYSKAAAEGVLKGEAKLAHEAEAIAAAVKVERTYNPPLNIYF